MGFASSISAFPERRIAVVMRRRGASEPHPAAAEVQRAIDERLADAAARRSVSCRSERHTVMSNADLADVKRPFAVRNPAFVERPEGKNGSEGPGAVPNLARIDEKSASVARSRQGAEREGAGALPRRSVA